MKAKCQNREEFVVVGWTDRAVAMAAGYYIRQGAYQGTPDDRLGRWYVGHQNADFWPHGAGYPTPVAAWRAAAHLARARQNADPAT